MSDKQPDKQPPDQQPEPQASEAAAESAQAPADVEAQLAEAQAKAQENWEQLLRARAELENLRRRTERDLENAHKYALERFVQELLPVKDSLELGLAAAEAAGEQAEKVREGVALTLKMLTAALEKFGVQEVHPQNEPFNPELHQAMMMQETSEHEPNRVLSVMQKGYLLHDRLVRPAMVVVAKGPEKRIDEQA